MKLGTIESAFMNNIVRKWFLRNLEARVFYRLLIKKNLIPNLPRIILEIGCGRGDAISIHEEFYKPSSHCTFDVDPILVEYAKAKIKSLNIKKIRITTGDILNIDEPNQKFDAVFGYGVLHHVRNWQRGLKEIARVLKPGGVYCWEEQFEYFNNLFLTKLILSHPKIGLTYNRWIDELEKNGLYCSFEWPIKNPFITLGISLKK